MRLPRGSFFMKTGFYCVIAPVFPRRLSFRCCAWPSNLPTFPFFSPPTVCLFPGPHPQTYVRATYIIDVIPVPLGLLSVEVPVVVENNWILVVLLVALAPVGEHLPLVLVILPELLNVHLPLHLLPFPLLLKLPVQSVVYVHSDGVGPLFLLHL